MRRLAGFLALVALAFSACSDPNEDADRLRSFVRASEREPRTLVVQSVTEDQEYTVRAQVEDELRYSMQLGSGGRDLLEYVVRDDAVAVRLLDPSFGSRVANVLGDPVVDSALKAGRWVLDPSGAPPLIQTDVVAGGETSGDPFRDAQGVLRYVDQAMGQAREVKEFTLEDIEYRSALDPWRYPEEDEGEVRYDLIRPFLPTSEAATVGAQGDIGPAQFRKAVVFVERRRVREVCSLVDIKGHEEFVELREQGLDSNPFLANLLRRIERGETANPIQERYLHAEIDYPGRVSVQIPADAVTGKLETFLTALRGGFEAGILRPSGRPDTSDCRRGRTGGS
jgi:hypothetical protein